MSRKVHFAGKCHYCGSRIYPPGSTEAIANPQARATKDHVLPQFFRSTDADEIESKQNIVPACNLCNNVKGGYPAEPFEFFLRETRGTARFNNVEFKKFIFGLALAGFRAARRDVLTRRPKPPPARSPQGRFTKRDLKRA
jgi:hypothetical protein